MKEKRNAYGNDPQFEYIQNVCCLLPERKDIYPEYFCGMGKKKGEKE